MSWPKGTRMPKAHVAKMIAGKRRAALRRSQEMARAARKAKYAALRGEVQASERVDPATPVPSEGEVWKPAKGDRLEVEMQVAIVADDIAAALESHLRSQNTPWQDGVRALGVLGYDVRLVARGVEGTRTMTVASLAEQAAKTNGT